LSFWLASDEVTIHDLPEFLRREKGGLEALEIDLPIEGISLESVEKGTHSESSSEMQLEPDARRGLSRYKS